MTLCAKQCIAALFVVLVVGTYWFNVHVHHRLVAESRAPARAAVQSEHVAANDIGAELAKRRRRILHLCQNLKNIAEQENSATVFTKLMLAEMHTSDSDADSSFMWCPVYKVATTFVKQYLTNITVGRTFALSTKHTNSHINDLITTKKYKSMLIVRHPFQRILSAYRDKLERRFAHEYYYKRFGKLMTYRRPQRPYQYRGRRREPTFVEFLQYLVELKGQSTDEHWRAYVDDCAPCFVKYDFILKFDNFHNEFNYFLRDHLNESVADRPHRYKTNSDVERRYYSQVSKHLLHDVYKVYEVDFKLFNYSPSEYYNYVQS